MSGFLEEVLSEELIGSQTWVRPRITWVPLPKFLTGEGWSTGVCIF